MLGSVLSKEKCAECRICCSFVKEDVWEAPTLTNPSTKEKYRVEYKFKDDKEILLCPGLDEKSGCMMGKDKPFECMIWPLRPFMKEDGKIGVALAKICPSFSEKNEDKLISLLEKGLYEKIVNESRKNPEIIKKLGDDYKSIY